MHLSKRSNPRFSESLVLSLQPFQGPPNVPRQLARVTLVLALVASLAGVARSQPAWQQVAQPVSPGLMARHEMVYDTVRQVTVLVDTVGQTWERTGGTWTNVQTLVAPEARYGHAMAFDATRGVTVLFGGIRNVDNSPLSDTWEYDGLTWTERLPAVWPAARWNHALAFDTARGKSVLFGGYNQYCSPTCVYGDTWEWDGSTWTMRTPATSPPERQQHSLAFDSARGVTVLFGGQKWNLIWYADTWEWNGDRWIERSGVVHPPTLAGHSMAYDALAGSVVLFGGQEYWNGPLSERTWRWNGVVWSELPGDAGTGPAARRDTAMAFDAAAGACLLYGGQGPAVYFDDLWSLGPVETPTFEIVVDGLLGPRTFELAGSTIYFADTGATDGSLKQVPKAGGSATTLISNTVLFDSGSYAGIDRIALTDATVYAGYGGYVAYDLVSVPMSGGAPTILASPSGGTFLGSSGGALYYFVNFCCVVKLPLDGTPAQTVLTGNFVRSSALDEHALYFYTYSSLEIRRFDLATQTLSILTTTVSEPSIFIDEAYVYLNDAGAIRRVPKAGGAVATIVPGPDVVGHVSDNANLYYTSGGDLFMRSLVDGVTQVLARNVTVHTLRVDGAFAYWSSPGASEGTGSLFRLKLPLTPGVLSFPLKGKLPGQDLGWDASSAEIVSVFDHTIGGSFYGPNACDGSVQAFTGDKGSYLVGPMNCAAKPGYGKDATLPAWELEGCNYTGTNQDGPSFLNYDGHRGYDFRAAMRTEVYAPADGTIYYPKSIVGAKHGKAWDIFNVLEMRPDGEPSMRVYFIHLATHPRLGNAIKPHGARVRRGELIAKTGDAGADGQPHLHFEVQRIIPKEFVRDAYKLELQFPEDPSMAGVPVDPYGWNPAAGSDPYLKILKPESGIINAALWN